MVQMLATAFKAEMDRTFVTAMRDLASYDANVDNAKRHASMVASYTAESNTLECIVQGYAQTWVRVLDSNVSLPGLTNVRVWRCLLQRVSMTTASPVAVMHMADPMYELLRLLRHAKPENEPLARLTYFLEAIGSMTDAFGDALAAASATLVSVADAPAPSAPLVSAARALVPPPPASNEHRFCYFLGKRYPLWRNMMMAPSSPAGTRNYRMVLSRIPVSVASEVEARGHDVPWHLFQVLDDHDYEGCVDRVTPQFVLDVLRPHLGTSGEYVAAVKAFQSFDSAKERAAYQRDVYGDEYTDESNSIKAFPESSAAGLHVMLNNTVKLLTFFDGNKDISVPLWEIILEHTQPLFPRSVVKDGQSLMRTLAQHPDEPMSRLTVFLHSFCSFFGARVNFIEAAKATLVKKGTVVALAPAAPLPVPAARRTVRVIPIGCTACRRRIMHPNGQVVCTECCCGFCVDCFQKARQTERHPLVTLAGYEPCPGAASHLRFIQYTRDILDEADADDDDEDEDDE